MNRKQRRAHRQPPKISGLPDDERAVLRALIKCWLTETEAGQALLQMFPVEDATSHICELADKGLVRFVKSRGRLGDGKTSFWVEPVLPAGWHEGGRA